MNPRTRESFTDYETIAGGYGAALANGMDAVQAHVQNTGNAPVEETEANYPVRIVRYELIEDSEGAGGIAAASTCGAIIASRATPRASRS